MLPLLLVQNQVVTRSDIMKLNAIWYDWDLGCLKPSARCTTGASSTPVPQYSYVS